MRKTLAVVAAFAAVATPATAAAAASSPSRSEVICLIRQYSGGAGAPAHCPQAKAKSAVSRERR
jgi:hypothetical protein